MSDWFVGPQSPVIIERAHAAKKRVKTRSQRTLGDITRLTVWADDVVGHDGAQKLPEVRLERPIISRQFSA